jgi:outer membrane lipoprotein SlyB
LLLACGLAGCASGVRPAMPAAPAVASAASGPKEGTVAAVRPIAPLPAESGVAPGADPAGAILAAMGVAAAPSGGRALTEIIVQTNDGQTLSVVQPNAAGLVSGAQVVLLPGPLPRLVKRGTASPAS